MGKKAKKSKIQNPKKIQITIKFQLEREHLLNGFELEDVFHAAVESVTSEKEPFFSGFMGVKFVK